MSSRQIHPSAIIEPNVKLGENVSIGPFCHIQSDVEIGDNSQVMSHVVIMSGTTLGSGAKVYPHAILGCDPQNNKHRGGSTKLIVGKNCVIREGVTMHRGSDSSIGVTTVGDDCMFLAYAHIAHDCTLGNHVTFSNNVMIGGHSVIGDHVIIGGGGAVHQFVRVGHNAFVGGVTALVNDLIPFGTAVGVNAKLAGLNIIGMKRAGLPRHEIHALRHAVQMIFDRTKTVHDRADDVRLMYPDLPAVTDLVSFITSGNKRSLCTPALSDAKL